MGAVVALAALGLVWFAALARQDRGAPPAEDSREPERVEASVPAARAVEAASTVHAAAADSVAPQASAATASSKVKTAAAPLSTNPEPVPAAPEPEQQQQGEEQLDALGFPPIAPSRLGAARARRLRERLDELKHAKREPPDF